MTGQNTKDRTEAIISLGKESIETRQEYTEALTASIRWYASSDNLYKDDATNLYRITQLLEIITGVKKAS